MHIRKHGKMGIAAIALSSVLVSAMWAAFPRSPSIHTGEIVPIAPMHFARASHTATLLPSGKVFIAGGFAGSGGERNPYSSLEIFDPATGKFSLAGNLTVGRSGHTATLLKSGKVLLAGGWGGSGPQGSAELYDPATGKSAVTGDMTTRRGGQTATLLPNGKVLLTGGEEWEGQILASAELYDPASGRFTPTGSMSSPRSAHTATLLSDGRVLITGGSYGRYPAAVVLASAEIYDPATGRFSLTGAMWVARHKHAAIRLADGQVLVLGGSDNRDWRGIYLSAELYDPHAGEFSRASNMRWARFKFPDAVVSLPAGNALVAGGAEGAEIYDPASRSFQLATGTFGQPRYFASATLLDDGRVLVTGGYDSGNRAEGPQSTSLAWIYQP